MAKLLSEEESGLSFGTPVKIKHNMALSRGSKEGCETWISITGAKCEAISLTFDRAGHNHYDELFAYCFKLPSGEEIWFEFLDSTEREDRVRRLRDFLEW